MEQAQAIVVENSVEPIDPKRVQMIKLRRAVRFFYDLQKLRIQSGNRNHRTRKDAEETIELDESDQLFLGKTGDGLNSIEEDALKEVARLLKRAPIYKKWLEQQKGIGPTMAGVLLASFDVERASSPSKFWAFAGLAVDSATGKSVRRVKGRKATFDPWLKSKVLKVMGDSFLKCVVVANGRYYEQWNARNPNRSALKYEGDGDENVFYVAHSQALDWSQIPWKTVRCRREATGKVWREFYDNYKNRKKNTLVPVCMGCEGKGTIKVEEEEEPRNASNPPLVSKPCQPRNPNSGSEPEKEKRKPCPNCGGTGHNAPWGRSDAHRHQAALRYMVKMFLLEFWLQWRTEEGLPTRVPYAEQYLGLGHHVEK